MQVYTLAQPRNEIGQYKETFWSKTKRTYNRIVSFPSRVYAQTKVVIRKAVKVTKIAYLVITLLGTVWGVWITHQTYQFRCQVNMHTVGYFSRRAECDQANQNWIDATQITKDQHNAEMLANNPDL